MRRGDPLGVDKQAPVHKERERGVFAGAGVGKGAAAARGVEFGREGGVVVEGEKGVGDYVKSSGAGGSGLLVGSKQTFGSNGTGRAVGQNPRPRVFV